MVVASVLPWVIHLSALRPKPRLLPPLEDEDEDVARERERVTKGATKGDLLVLRDLTKVGPGWGQVLGWGWHRHSVPSQEVLPLQVYRGQKSPAVDRLCLGIPPGEVSAGLGKAGGCPLFGFLPSVCPSPSLFGDLTVHIIFYYLIFKLMFIFVALELEPRGSDVPSRGYPIHPGPAELRPHSELLIEPSAPIRHLLCAHKF